MLHILAHSGLMAHHHPHAFDHIIGGVFAAALLIALVAGTLLALPPSHTSRRRGRWER